MSNLFIVYLRRPAKDDPREDPFWEFGSFGCTGCHRKNLLSSNCQIVSDDQLAFVQGGDRGARLLLITPPVTLKKHPNGFIEVTWKPAGQQPFCYKDAPVLACPKGDSEFPKLSKEIANVDRSTLPAKLASRFRARASAVPEDLSEELRSVYEEKRRNAPPGAISQTYTDALPRVPEAATNNRREAYRKVLLNCEVQANHDKQL